MEAVEAAAAAEASDAAAAASDVAAVREADFPSAIGVIKGKAAARAKPAAKASDAAAAAAAASHAAVAATSGPGSSSRSQQGQKDKQVIGRCNGCRKCPATVSNLTDLCARCHPHLVQPAALLQAAANDVAAGDVAMAAKKKDKRALKRASKKAKRKKALADNVLLTRIPNTPRVPSSPSSSGCSSMDPDITEGSHSDDDVDIRSETLGSALVAAVAVAEADAAATAASKAAAKISSLKSSEPPFDLAKASAVAKRAAALGTFTRSVAAQPPVEPPPAAAPSAPSSFPGTFPPPPPSAPPPAVGRDFGEWGQNQVALWTLEQQARQLANEREAELRLPCRQRPVTPPEDPEDALAEVAAEPEVEVEEVEARFMQTFSCPKSL
jgi:hypothetical protein